MATWHPHTFRLEAEENGVDAHIVERAMRNAAILQARTPGAPPIFTLKHLAQQTGVSYGFLRECVERNTPEPYRLFRIRKRQLGDEKKQRYRIICVPDARLMTVQRWIHANILSTLTPHPSSVAFKRNSNIVDASKPHCGCRWLIKLDIQNFFEAVSEQTIYRVFHGAGYQPLVAFELSRLCTRLGKGSYARRGRRWHNAKFDRSGVRAYVTDRLGHLPQGAPTSPLLANLSVRDLDREILDVAISHGLVYTRYADDLTLSSVSKALERDQIKSVISELYALLRSYGFEPNLAKTKIVPPGARKVVLGLLVDSAEPRLTKEFRDRLRQHLHYMCRKDVGSIKHARAKGFQSVYGLRNHVAGLIAYAAQVDRPFAAKAWDQLNAIEWP